MYTRISGQDFDVSPRLRRHIEDRIGRLARFRETVSGCRVTIAWEGSILRAVVFLHVRAQTLKATHEAEDVNVAVEGAMVRAERQLKKLKEKRRTPRRNPSGAIEAYAERRDLEQADSESVPQQFLETSVERVFGDGP